MLLNILNIVGSLALFIFGMKILSDGIQRISGNKFRQQLNKVTVTPISGTVTGLFSTAIIQSSSAFSVLLISLVNAKIVNLKRAFSLMIGSNIGTTTTLWLLIFGLSWHIELLVLPLIAAAIPLFLNSNPKRKYWGQTIIGFSLIFIGLYFLKINLPEGGQIFKFFNPNLETSFLYYLVFIFLGFIITAILQSSSVTTGLILVAISNTESASTLIESGQSIPEIPLNLACMMIIGANIGTTITSNIAAYVGDVNSKAVAAFHTIYNIVGALIFIFLTNFLLEFLVGQFQFKQTSIYLAIFHSVFNVVTGFIFLVSIKFWVNLFFKLIKKYGSKIQQNNEIPIHYNPDIHLFEANREILKFTGTTKQTINILGRLITESNEEKFNELNERAIALEEQSDEIEKVVLNHLRRIYDFETSGEISKRVHILMDVCYHLENVSDMAIKTADIHLKRRESNSYITPKLRSLLIEMHENLAFATTILIQNLNEQPDKLNLNEAKKVERLINQYYEESHQSLIRALEKEKIPMLSILYYKELIQNYEIIGDHLFKANKALTAT